MKHLALIFTLCLAFSSVARGDFSFSIPRINNGEGYRIDFSQFANQSIPKSIVTFVTAGLGGVLGTILGVAYGSVLSDSSTRFATDYPGIAIQDQMSGQRNHIGNVFFAPFAYSFGGLITGMGIGATVASQSYDYIFGK